MPTYTEITAADGTSVCVTTLVEDGELKIRVFRFGAAGQAPIMSGAFAAEPSALVPDSNFVTSPA